MKKLIFLAALALVACVIFFYSGCGIHSLLERVPVGL